MEQLVLKPTSQIRRLRFRKMMRFTQYPPASTCRHQFWTRRAPRLCTTLRDVGSFQNKNQTHKYKLVAAGGGPVGKIDQEVPTSSCEKSFLSKEHWRTRSSRHCSTGPKIEHHSQRIRFRDPAWGAGQSRSWSGKVLALRPAPAIYLLVQGDRPPPSVRTPALLATEPAHGKRVGIGETVRTSKRHTQLSRCPCTRTALLLSRAVATYCPQGGVVRAKMQRETKHDLWREDWKRPSPRLMISLEDARSIPIPAPTTSTPWRGSFARARPAPTLRAKCDSL